MNLQDIVAWYTMGDVVVVEGLLEGLPLGNAQLVLEALSERCWTHEEFVDGGEDYWEFKQDYWDIISDVTGYSLEELIDAVRDV